MTTMSSYDKCIYSSYTVVIGRYGSHIVVQLLQPVYRAFITCIAISFESANLKFDHNIACRFKLPEFLIMCIVWVVATCYV